ncbi:MAG: M1 family aminopeptidase [Bacteroidales bacterium]
MKIRMLFLASLLIAAALPAYSQYHHGDGPHLRSFKRSIISDTLDAVKYEIHLNEVNTTDQTLAANTFVTLVPKVDNLQQLTLELLDLTVDQVFVNGVEITGFTHANPMLYIPLNNPVNTGDTLVAEVVYHGQPFHEDWGGFHWSGEYAFNLGVGFVSDPHNLGKAWFPCIDDFHDRALYEIYVTTENPKKAVCGGTLMQTIDNGDGTTTWHWKLHDDIPTYLASVAVGEYENVPSSFTSVSGQEIPIGIWVKPYDTAKVAGSFATLVPVLEAFEEYFGPYRWERVGYVGTAIGAMEHSTNIAYPHFCINGTLAYESLMAHELSHQYFGDLVTCASAEDMWLNEGWAVFCESLYREAIYGPEAYHADMFSRHKNVLQTAHITDGSYLALYGIPTEYTYGMTVYQKGALVTHSLRHYMGDELFFPAVKAYIEEFEFDYASSWELRDFLSAHSGMELTDFFDAWVFAPGFPEFSIDSFNVQPSGGNFEVTVYARQKWKGPDNLANSNRVEVTFMNTGHETETHLMEFSGATGSQTFTSPFEPEIVMMDFYDKACDATTDLKITISEPEDMNLYEIFAKLFVENIPAGDSIFLRMTHRWVPPDSLKQPVNGLMLSDKHHWRVDGIIPEGTVMAGSFMYNKYNDLDNNLMEDPNDSLVILYRPSRAAEWQGVASEMVGSPFVGYYKVLDLQPGEYTLAVWDDQFVNIKEQSEPKTKGFRLYPNPSNNMVTIESPASPPSQVIVFDANARQVSRLVWPEASGRLEWNVNDMPDGTYLLKFLDGNGKEIAAEKLIIN